MKLSQLRDVVHEKIAQYTQNEAAVVTAGAIVGIYIAAASCISLKYGKLFRFLKKEEIAPCEFIMFRAHRNAYDRGIELTGAKLVELGFPNPIDMITEAEFENAINENTAGVFYVANGPQGWVSSGALSVERTIALCKKHNIPIIVDGAAQLPPKSNLWNFTKNMGATAVIFSGGKYLKGPQTTGLVLGQKRLLSWMVENNFPNYGIGRMHKVGREEMVGIYNAVKEYAAFDEAAADQAAEDIVSLLVNGFAPNDRFYFERSYPNESGQPMARAKLQIADPNLTPEQVQVYLEAQPRSIYTMVENGYIYINPMMMDLEEGTYVLESFQRLNGIV